MCKRRVCEDCGPQVIELEKQVSVMRAEGYLHALVCGGAAESVAAISKTLKSRLAYVWVERKLERNRFCQMCLSEWNQLRISSGESTRRQELMGQVAMDVERDISRIQQRHVLALAYLDAPHIPHTCRCAGFSTGCPYDSHIVGINKVPVESELVGLLTVPRAWQYVIPLQPVIPVYVMDTSAQSDPA